MDIKVLEMRLLIVVFLMPCHESAGSKIFTYKNPEENLS